MSRKFQKLDARVVFRVDSGTRLGSGHVIRCLTLAGELNWRRASVSFVCRELPGHLIGRIEDEGYQVQILPGDSPMSMSEASSPDQAKAWAQEDAVETLSVLSGTRPDWIVLDHYWLGTGWEQALQPAVGRMLVIDDLLNREHTCDVLLDQNWRGAEPGDGHYERRGSPGIRLMGPRYALLQPQYAQLRRIMPPRDKAIGRVLVFFGDSDPTDETGKALEALALPEFAHLAVDVVLGSNHPNREAIFERVAARPATTLHENLATLAGLMFRVDLAIGAGGSTTWERICLDLPSLVTTLAANQEPATKALAGVGVLRWMGRSADTTVDHYRDALREKLRRGAQSVPLVDGFGAKRVAEIMMPTDDKALNLRLAVAQDAALFFEWRNDPLARAMSFTEEPVSWGNHLEWLRRMLRDRNANLYVAEADGLPIGQVRLQFEQDEGVLSYALDPLVRGRGWSRWMISQAVGRTKRARSANIKAVVKPENEASRKVFARLGWAESRSAQGTIVYQSKNRNTSS